MDCRYFPSSQGSSASVLLCTTRVRSVLRRDPSMPVVRPHLIRAIGVYSGEEAHHARGCSVWLVLGIALLLCAAMVLVQEPV